MMKGQYGFSYMSEPGLVVALDNK